MAPIRILIADDSHVMRLLYREVLQQAGDFAIVGEVGDGQAAVEACERLRPQVVAMDITMPTLSGIAATAAIMARCPTPVVIVSNALDSRASRLAMQAFEAGAVDVVAKPNMTDRAAGQRAIRHLVDTLRAMSAVRVMRRVVRQAPLPAGAAPLPPVAGCRIIGIGASTGGPEAVKQLLAPLPADFPVPIVVVQHMVPEFLPSLVAWLDSTVPLPVSLASHGAALPSRGVLIAPGKQHLRVEAATCRLHLDPAAGGAAFHPSVDVLFDSLTGFGSAAAGVLLTGMGQDGAAGLGRLKAAGAVTLAQDEASSTVWGMPGVAIRGGAATVVGSPGQLATYLLQLAAPAQPAP